MQYLAWLVLNLWRIGTAGCETYAAAVVVLDAGSEDGGDPLR